MKWERIMKKVMLLSALAVLAVGCNLNQNEKATTPEYVYDYDAIDYTNLYQTDDSLVKIKKPQKEYTDNKQSIKCKDSLEKNEPKNKYRTFNACLKAARNGDPEIQFAISELYRTGTGVAKNLRNSFFWCEKAAKQGYIKAQSILGYKYLEGVGTGRNNERGIFWLTKAAEQGDVSAAYSLGGFYQAGSHSIDKDLGRSYKWHIRAATWGLPIAQESIALKTYNGEGLPADKVEGLAWAMIVDNCTTNKSQNDNLVNELSKGLSQKQIEQAKLSSDLLFKKYNCDKYVTYIIK